MFCFPVISPPAKCPSAEAIIIKGLDINRLLLLKSNEWVVTQPNSNYDTNDTWTFGFGFFSSQDDPALMNAEKAFQSLHFVEGPILTDDNKWACRYITNDGKFGSTFCPHY